MHGAYLSSRTICFPSVRDIFGRSENTSHKHLDTSRNYLDTSHKHLDAHHNYLDISHNYLGTSYVHLDAIYFAQASGRF